MRPVVVVLTCTLSVEDPSSPRLADHDRDAVGTGERQAIPFFFFSFCRRKPFHDCESSSVCGLPRRERERGSCCNAVRCLFTCSKIDQVLYMSQVVEGFSIIKFFFIFRLIVVVLVQDVSVIGIERQVYYADKDSLESPLCFV